MGRHLFFFKCCALVVASSHLCLALSASTPPPRRVAVIGGTGRLGREAVKKLSSAGIFVNCLVRFDPQRVNDDGGPDDLQNATSDQIKQYLKALPNVDLIQGDATSLDSLRELLGNGCTACLALHGATRMSKLSDIWNKNAEQDAGHAKLVNYEGIGNLIKAAEESKTCKRIVRITGKGEEPTSFFSVLINMFGSMAKGWNYEGECLLRKSNVDYTIIRPGIMKPTEKRDPSDAVLALKDNGGDLPVSAVSYADIASLSVECLDYPNAARSTLTAMNVEDGKGETLYAPLLAKVQPDTRDFPPTLIEEHKRAVRTTVSALAAVFAGLLVGALSMIKSWFFR